MTADFGMGRLHGSVPPECFYQGSSAVARKVAKSLTCHFIGKSPLPLFFKEGWEPLVKVPL